MNYYYYYYYLLVDLTERLHIVFLKLTSG